MKLFLVTAAAILQTAYTACDSGWIEHGNSCYKFTTDVQNWVGARSMCKFHGADLAMAETQSENEWIKSEARRANHTAPEEGFWLGATDFIEEGHWYWESTRPLEFTYTDWGHLEPNNRFDRQHCLAILKFFDYHWGDEKCDWDNLNYVCEKGWSPDSRHILTTADFNLRITVWSLITKSVSYIRYPKQCQKGIDFSVDGRYMVLAERRDCQDFISIFACDSWELVKHFDTDTEDLAGVEWAPSGRVLCVWESPLQYKVLLYSLDGRCLSKYSAYEYALGIKCLQWSPTSQFLAIGSYDERVRLLNHVTWKTVATIDHPENIESKNLVVYKESETRAPPPPSGDLTDIPTATLFAPQSKFEVQQVPVKVPVVKPDTNKPNPKRGVGTVLFSSDCRYMCTRNDNMPHTLWIWDIKKLAHVAVLIQSSPIRSVAWDPKKPRLALCTGTNKLYMWSPAGSLCVEIPVEGTFQVYSIKWHSDGSSLLLLGKDQMCMCYLNDNVNETESPAN